MGGVENEHSTDVESPLPPPRVCMSIHFEERSCFDLGRVLVLNDPPAWWWARARAATTRVTGRGLHLHSSTFRLNVSTFCGIRCVASVCQ